MKNLIMHFLKTYHDTIILYDLANKFTYLNSKKLPQFNKVSLSFSRKNNNLKDFISMILFFEILFDQKITINNIISYKKSNVLVKIKKGSPVGCKVILNKSKLYDVFEFLYADILINKKNYKQSAITSSSLSFNIINPIKIREMDRYYYSFFKSLPWLNVTFFTTAKTTKELLYLSKAYKLVL